MSTLILGKQKVILVLVMLICFTGLFSVTAQQICQTEIGTSEDYIYDFWTDNVGTTCMTLGPGGTFSTEWSECYNFLARRGYIYDNTQTHQELGTISCTYSCDYHPEGNSYLCVYGRTQSPLVEYYIVDSWGTWRPPGNDPEGTIVIDGDTYEIFRNIRSPYPGINSAYTYWSVRTTKRTSGTISISQHFKAWEDLGWEFGKIHDITLGIEGYQSSGSANVTSLTLNVETTTDQTPIPAPKGDVNDDGTADIIDALIVAQYYVGLVDTLDTDAADVNCDESIDIVDALLVAQYYVGLITVFC
ncbi:MAG: glycoside hydrolase family 11 protein [Spirochaetales bacterium]|nr:glycoside hydrolase family 11 protein [Spirochaetales bacterium]